MSVTGADYRAQLMAFEPKMRSMVGNFIRTGYRFDGYDEDDLIQELMVKALEIESYYDAEKAALRTFWYRCFASRLSQLATRSARQGAIWRMMSDHEDDVMDVAEEPGIEARRRRVSAVDRMLRSLAQEDPALARTAAAVMDCDGDVEQAAAALRQEPQRVRWALSRMRGMVRDEII